MSYNEFLEGVGRAADKLSPKAINILVFYFNFKTLMSDEAKKNQPLHLKIESVAFSFYSKIMKADAKKEF